MKTLLQNKMLLYGGGAVAAVLLAMLFFSGGEKQKGPGQDEVRALQEAPGYTQAVQHAGEREGTWTNATFATKGSITSSLVVNKDGTAALTVDLGGLVFGLVDPDPKTFQGTYDASGILVFSGNDDLFGDFTITVSPDGRFVMVAPDVIAPGIDRVEANGDLQTAHYIIHFTGGSRAEGSVQMVAK